MDHVKKHRSSRSTCENLLSPRKSPVKLRPKRQKAKKTQVVQDLSANLSYTIESLVGTGTFGSVYKSTDPLTGKKIAIKKVLQDPRFNNRESEILKELKHPNIIPYYGHFFSNGTKASQTYLNLIMQYFPHTLATSLSKFTASFQKMPMILIKLYSYQLLRSLMYCDLQGICHRDIKPSNLLVDLKSHKLVLCDFGSAKKLISGQPNLAYICSRFYRAPELILGATNYGTLSDVWGAGCVIAELVLGKPIFCGANSNDQFVEILKVLGPIREEEIMEINPGYKGLRFPEARKTLWTRVFSNNLDYDLCDLIEKILTYLPSKRYTALQALQHPFFDEIKKENSRLPNGVDLKELFNWNEVEINAGVADLLTPDWLKEKTIR